MNGYQFSVLRYVHDVSTGEFVNVGVVAWSLPELWIETRLNERYARTSAFFADFDGAFYRRFLRTIERRLRDVREGLEQGDLLLSPGEEFSSAIGELLREDDSAFQWSHAMGGIADDFSERVDELFHEFVLRHEQLSPRDRRDDADVARILDRSIRSRGLLTRLGRGISLRSEDYEYSFHVGWQNGMPQVLEPISFDYVRGGDIVEKANTWGGRLFNLSRRNEFQFTGVVAPPRDAALSAHYERALSILRHAPSVRTLVDESDIEAFIPEIEADLERDEPSVDDT